MSALDDELNELTEEMHRRVMRDDEREALADSELQLNEATKTLAIVLAIAKRQRTRTSGDKIDSRDVGLIAEVLAAGLQTFAKTAIYCVRLSWRYKRGLDAYR